MVDGSGLENQRGESLLGFESLSPRHKPQAAVILREGYCVVAGRLFAASS